MPLQIALLVAVTSVKNNRLFSYGLAKYKVSNEISQTVRWKYFYPMNKQSQLFIPRDLVFISEKYVIKNLEQ
ncbi:21411_t:CDS:1, partial [Gigaspora margarita]